VIVNDSVVPLDNLAGAQKILMGCARSMLLFMRREVMFVARTGALFVMLTEVFQIDGKLSRAILRLFRFIALALVHLVLQ